MCPCSYFLAAPCCERPRATPPKKGKKEDFLLKLAEGRKLSSPGETQLQGRIKSDG